MIKNELEYMEYIGKLTLIDEFEYMYYLRGMTLIDD